MQYDMTVRNSEQSIVQFSYGDDGLSPHLMEKGDRPVDYERMRINVAAGESDFLEGVGVAYNGGLGMFGAKTAVMRDLQESLEEDTLSSKALVELVKRQLADERFQVLLPQGQQVSKRMSKLISGLKFYPIFIHYHPSPTLRFFSLLFRVTVSPNPAFSALLCHPSRSL